MSATRAMMRKDCREMLLTPTSYTGVALLVAYTAMMCMIITKHVSRFAGMDKPLEEIAQALQAEINGITLSLAILSILGLAMGAATTAVMMEKKERKLESLLATPVTIHQLWKAKSFTLAWVCIPLGTVTATCASLALCCWVINPQLNLQIWPAPSVLVAVLVVIPLAMYFLLDIYVGLQFVISNYRFSSILFVVLLGGAIALNIVFQETEESWLRYALLGAVACGLGLIDLWLATFVTAERVVLSSKG